MSITTTNTAAKSDNLQHTATVVDEAFADLPDLAIRVDEAQSATSAGHYVAETERLVSRISQQLKAIDRQRSRLVQLLRGLDTPSPAETSGTRD
ncbi:hypothetical protein NG895_05810 [Aeoliella sp. ICT_H6.2]|uniref:Uncharacterized protein n=1 Tax=Aeoliella straminimaris TaxID=2954799 RepID=A0A9X2FCE7_9BACT|nr:hypothetical protein [Aeoliella straminimaris]MCO6043416.1 hypothetical protein [Aeoliella straminimaris]